MRQPIINKLEEILTKISTVNGYQTNFDKIVYWQDTPTEYSFNYLIYRDTTEEYERKGNSYLVKLALEIVAIVIENSDNQAANLGNLAIEDLIKAMANYQLCDTTLKLTRSHKFIETRGKTACQVELELSISYQIKGLP